MESDEQKVPTGGEGEDPVERIKSALREYEAAYDSLTDGTDVQTMKKLLENIEGEQPGGIVSMIIDESIRETRRRQRPELRTPLSLKDELVRKLVHVLGATDHEKVLGDRISELESDLKREREPRNLREHMLRLLDDGMDKDTIGSVVCCFFDGIRDGLCVCCCQEPSVALVGRPEDVTAFACVDGGDGTPYLVVLTSPDSARAEGDGASAVVFPMAKVMDGLREYEALGGLAFDPWDRGGLYLKRDFLLGAWERNQKFWDDQKKA